MTGRYDLGQLRVLILEDNERMLALLTGVLKALKVRDVLALTDADEAFKNLSLFGPDLVITDWHMAPVDGLEFVRKVRQAPDSPNPFVPIIMVTGHTALHRVGEARDTGVHEVLAKPISPKSLYSRILHVVENPRAFVRSPAYFGPDRRRKDVGPPEGTAERRSDAQSDPTEAGNSGDKVEI